MNVSCEAGHPCLCRASWAAFLRVFTVSPHQCIFRNLACTPAFLIDTWYHAHAVLRYQDYQAEEIKTVEQDGAKIRVMAGDSHGVTGPIAMRNPGLLLDVTLAKGAAFCQEVGTFTGSSLLLQWYP